MGRIDRHPHTGRLAVELVLPNKHQISGGGAYLDCYPMTNLSRVSICGAGCRCSVSIHRLFLLYINAISAAISGVKPKIVCELYQSIFDKNLHKLNCKVNSCLK